MSGGRVVRGIPEFLYGLHSSHVVLGSRVICRHSGLMGVSQNTSSETYP